MHERERAVADRLLAAETPQAVETALFESYVEEPYDIDGLLTELRVRRQRLLQNGRPAEAALVAALTGAVREHRALLERLAQEHGRTDAGRRRNSWPRDLRPPEHLTRSVLEQGVADLVDQGDLDRALQAAHRAAGVPLVDPAESVVVTSVRLSLAQRLREAGRPRDALDVLEEAGLPPSVMGDSANMEIAAARLHILRGLLWEDVGDYRLGRRAYRTALDHAVRVGAVSWRFKAWTCLAASYGKSGRYRQAVTEYRRIVAFARTLTDAHAHWFVAALNDLGTALRDAGDRDAARSHHLYVLALFEKSRATGASQSAAWFRLGDLARDEEDTAGALTAYTNGFWSAIAADVVRQGVLDTLSRLHRALPGDDELLETATLFCMTVLNEEQEDWLLTWSLRRALGGLAQRLGRHEGAVAQLRELARDAATRGRQWRLSAAGELADGLLLWHEQEGPPGTLQEAFDILWQARAGMAADLDDTAGTSADHHAVVTDYRHIHVRLVDLLLDHGREVRSPDSRTPTELAFDLYEEIRAGAHLRQMARAPMTPPDSVPEEVRRAEEELLAALSDPSPGVEQRRATEARLAGVHDLMAAHAPDYVRLRRGRPHRFEDLRSHLRSRPDAEHIAFVSFHCGARSTIVFTYVPGTDRLTVVRAPVGEERLSEVTRLLRHTFDGSPHDFPPRAPLHPRRPWRRDISFLAELTPLLAAFLPVTDGRELLYVCSDGPLHGLPLSAVPTPEGPPLAARHAVAHVSGASALLHAAARHQARRKRRTQRTPEVFCASVAAREDPVPEQLEGDAELLRAAGWPATALTGEHATRQAVLQRLDTAAVAHITCHGYFDTREPLDSGLLLAQNGRRPSKLPEAQSLIARLDHMLTVRDLARRALPTRLLTLRACATGLRDEHSAGDVEGLVQALLYAGAGTVVAALWNVDECSSRRLLVDFYSRLRSDPDQPLWRVFWQAQKKMFETPSPPWEAHPYHWAALALFSDRSDDWMDT
ncbi:CHAT domain-containing protein [Streptomyces sp. NBC_00272]|uniref:CHAT domain-containing protein n=1 Tax=Streptomyces sp. NBC_00272 TaxID=2975698 RepID=UPI002E2D0B40|nr:CHAT domain-containing tetratricopeptide repeat protein [Streptomyces sp. NBC_00272]